MSGGQEFRQGLADALGFVLGALGGWQLGKLLGYDFIASTEWQLPQLIGLVFILLGCGLGRWLARKLLLR
ncbi:MAG: hypothetical protein ACK4S6_08020 [Roseateles asaccharophilus]|jgi:hypothetical protein|uniref:Uncharacterized protein n=1 Tax=Roseateles asaccharophilus TaxID=582607 RepID=A0A4R6MTJ8_9BURK|nr:hypothetical protein [Roseateles asaccharophilus]MDN3546272.1 hypothetical protein [Roseateles asaccharophilus]TDP05626.1 hypothetical protein DFR39_11051 [Roseateles asaccharophilus]